MMSFKMQTILSSALVFLCFARVNASVSAELTRGLTQFGGGIPTHAQQVLDDARVEHVRQILCKRLHAVLSGSRSRQFERWASRKRGDLRVISMHGVNETEIVKFDFGDGSGSISSTDGIFPDDVINLSLVPGVDVPSQYRGKEMNQLEDGISLLNLVARSIHLSLIFAPVACTSLLAIMSSAFREHVWFRWVASCLASSGPAFIKWGQWASTRSDMFPESLCVAMSQLHSDAPSHSWKYTKNVMESSLGLPKGSLLQVFDSFDERPLASGSIAQVHRATLDGITVVAKVRHPRVSKLISMDFRLMRILAGIADWLPALSWLHVRDSVEQFSHTMAAQAHLNVEGHHLEVLNYNFRKWNHVKFPKPLYASSAAIIETFESGRIVTSLLDDYDALASEVVLDQGSFVVEEGDEMDNTQEGIGLAYQVVPMDVAKFIVTTGLSLYLKMLLVDKQMHADLHPGNIMLDVVAPMTSAPSSNASIGENSSNRRNQNLGITLVDAGMVAQLSEDESTNFIGLLCSLGDGDGKVAARCALRFSHESKLTDKEEVAFIEDMDEMFKERCRGYNTNTNVGHVLRGVLGLIRKHKVRIDANYATLVVNVLCIESLSQRVCPSFNALDSAKPLLQAYQGLCYNKKDGSLNTHPTAIQKGLFRLNMPLAYLKKTVIDNTFFSRQSRQTTVALRSIESTSG